MNYENLLTVLPIFQFFVIGEREQKRQRNEIKATPKDREREKLCGNMNYIISILFQTKISIIKINKTIRRNEIEISPVTD